LAEDGTQFKDFAMPKTQYFLNGIDAATGEYLSPQAITSDEVIPFALKDAQSWFLNERPDSHHASLASKVERAQEKDFALAPHLDAMVLSQVGWGVVFASDVDPRIVEALQPLLELRRDQAGANYFCFDGAIGHLAREQTKQQFLGAHGVADGMPADPAQGLPYYMLIVGDPERIPFRFQYELDVEYAVGRLCFDNIDDYDRYARSVVQAESIGTRAARVANFFGVENPGDRATELSSQHLANPLATELTRRHPQWRVVREPPNSCTKSRLSQALADSPTLLFTASHGLGFKNDNGHRRRRQGSLVMADWPGRDQWKGALPEDFCFAGNDIAATTKLTGSMAFLFACYGAGTPAQSDFPHEGGNSQAPREPFVAALPQRMLAQGALAVVGHVDRAWGYSFLGPNDSPQVGVFQATLGAVMAGKPIGLAMEWFNQRYAALATLLTGKLMNAALFDLPIPETERESTARLWTEHNDARSYVILGDPATRLPL
jgi:hypothetical protein